MTVLADLTWQGWQFDLVCLAVLAVLLPFFGPPIMRALERHFSE